MADVERDRQEPELRLHVSTYPDMETRAELFNRGYDAAMSQHLADDPSAADDWLEEHDAATRLDQQKRDAKIARESFSLNAHLYSRRAGEKIALAIEEQES